jgi:signal transduction histidine kinase
MSIQQAAEQAAAALRVVAQQAAAALLVEAELAAAALKAAGDDGPGTDAKAAALRAAAQLKASELLAGAAMQAEQLKAAVELARVNQSLESFASAVSHDLRSPLRAMAGFSTALLEDYGDQLDETGQDYVRKIHAASERMAALIDALLGLAQESRAAMTLTAVDLGGMAADIIAELQRTDPARHVRFAIARPVWVLADHALIRAVMQNLLDNAWKFTSHRDDALIEFGTIPGNAGIVTCFIRDDGAGFDPAYINKLFRPFQRLHPTSEFPGTGIGLASVKQIVERHGGRIWAESVEGEGAAFYLTLGTAKEPA